MDGFWTFDEPPKIAGWTLANPDTPMVPGRERTERANIKNTDFILHIFRFFAKLRKKTERANLKKEKHEPGQSNEAGKSPHNLRRENQPKAKIRTIFVTNLLPEEEKHKGNYLITNYFKVFIKIRYNSFKKKTKGNKRKQTSFNC